MIKGLPRLRKGEKDYLDGYLDAYNDLPDGAWRAACENAIAVSPQFKGRDPYDVWLAWCNESHSE